MFSSNKASLRNEERGRLYFQVQTSTFPRQNHAIFQAFRIFLPNYLLTALCCVHFFVLCYALSMAPFAKSVYSAVYLFSREWKLKSASRSGQRISVFSLTLHFMGRTTTIAETHFYLFNYYGRRRSGNLEGGFNRK